MSQDAASGCTTMWDDTRNGRRGGERDALLQNPYFLFSRAGGRKYRNTVPQIPLVSETSVVHLIRKIKKNELD